MDLILGIESSCDETAAAVVADGRQTLSNIVASQIKAHAPYGGVVPELAAREHLKAIAPVARQALEKTGVGIGDIAAIAVTNGPGLIPALLVGLNFARGAAVANKLPLIGVNHFLAHIYSVFLDDGFEILRASDVYPLLALVVSGGHTALTLVDADRKARIVGETIDDASGEALDKAAKLLGLGYPGGPVIERVAKNGDPKRYHFPRSLTAHSGKPLDERNRFNFSFSGVKTALLYHVKSLGGAEKLVDDLLNDTVASYQQAVVDVLVSKALDAMKFFSVKSIVLCGGVAQNTLLRETLRAQVPGHVRYLVSPRAYCADNAAMVAGLAWHAFRGGTNDGPLLDAYSRLPEITEVPFG